MTTQNPEHEDARTPAASSRWLPAAAIVLGLGLAGSIITLVHQHSQLVTARMEVTGLQREVAAIRQDVGVAEAHARQQLEALKEEMATTRKDAEQTYTQVRTSARKQTEALISKAVVNQEKQHQEMTAELDRVKDAAQQASARLTDIGTEVGGVKNEVGVVKTQMASTRTDLDKTTAELHRATGDMGVMSGLIATNSKELAALRALGERDYFEFTLSKAQARRAIGGVNLAYKKADPKRNRYTLVVVADDRRVEKKDRTVNEPVQFYVPSKARQPYEIVINEVKKDTIVGYLSVPKTQLAQR